MTDDTRTLEQRVAALEALVEPLTRRTRGFLKDCRIDTFGSDGTVRVTHLPTGVQAEGEWGQAVAGMGRALLERGDVTINDVRAALGYRPFPDEAEAPAG